MKRLSTSGALAWINVLLGVVAVLYPVMLYASAVLGGSWWNVYSPSQILPFLFPAFIPLTIGRMLLKRDDPQRWHIWLTIGGCAIGIAGLVGTQERKTLMQEDSDWTACVSNLCILDAAKEQWAFEHHVSDGTPPITNEVTQFIKGDTMPTCPTTGRDSYRLNIIGAEPECVFHGSRFKPRLRGGTKQRQ